jgi:hypothetical protein
MASRPISSSSSIISFHEVSFCEVVPRAQELNRKGAWMMPTQGSAGFLAPRYTVFGLTA